MCTEGLLDFITVLWSWPLGNKGDAALKLIASKHMSKKDCINVNTRRYICNFCYLPILQISNLSVSVHMRCISDFGLLLELVNFGYFASLFLQFYICPYLMYSDDYFSF